MAWYDGNDTTLAGVSTQAGTTYSDSIAAGTNFGSPGFNVGDKGAYTAEDMEVKLMHRFRVKFGVFNQVGHHVKTITRPSVTFAEVEVAKLNSKVYFAGRKTQDQATIELDDSLDNAVTKAAQTQLQAQANFNNSMHARSAGSYFFNMVAEELTGDAQILMGWYYNKCVVITCDFGTLDYSDDAGTATINMGVRYSNFTTDVKTFTYGVGSSRKEDTVAATNAPLS